MATVKSEPINWGDPDLLSSLVFFPTTYASKRTDFHNQNSRQVPQVASFNTVHCVICVCGQDVELEQRETKQARI